MLARDMLAAGWAKAYHPAAAVVHSHDYPPRQLLRRSFDEGARTARGARATAAMRWPLARSVVQRHVRDDLALARAEGAGWRCWRRGRSRITPRDGLGAALGVARGPHAPPGPRRFLSLEGRDGFEPQC